MSVIGSNENGEIGTAETEITAFQPFFVEHNPPRILTEGDQISLPVVLRNYLNKSQTVDLEMKPESWFTLTGPDHQRASVPAGDSSRETFDLKVVAAVKDGSFPAHEYSLNPDPRRTALLTAYVAHILVMTQSKGKPTPTQEAANQTAVLKRALDYLAQRTSEIDEPYLLASYALAAFDGGDAARAGPAIAKLRALARQEGNMTYWSLEKPTRRFMVGDSRGASKLPPS